MMNPSFIDRMKRYVTKFPVTSVLLLLNTVMLFVVMLSGGFTLENLVRLGGLMPSKVNESGEYYRLLSSMFLHGSLLHFLANSYFLFHLGAFLEQLLGKGKYTVIYFISGLGSGVLVWMLGKPETVTIGASGALFGILGALLLLSFVRTSWFTPQGIKVIRTLTIINLVFTLVIPNISIWGHLGGFITGFILIYFLKPTEPDQRFVRQENDQENNQVVRDIPQQTTDEDNDDDLFD